MLSSGDIGMLDFGGRSIEDLGIGYEIDVHAQTGAAGLSVPVPAPPGRGGLGPALSLTYSSGAGNSAFGAGWSLAGLPSIGIDTHARVPRWDGRDGYQLGGEELVPWLERQGSSWHVRSFAQGDHTVLLYRSRTSGAAIRAERWVHRPSGRVHWRTRDAQNVLTIYGARTGNAARIADPDDDARTYLWLPELKVDPHGNAVWLEYAAETLHGVDRSIPFERRRPALAQRYLKRIRYGNTGPLALSDDILAGSLPAELGWCFQLVLDYGDHADPALPGAEPDRAWPARRDAFSYHRAGFEIRTYRLCRRILSFHELAELGPGPTLVGSLVLDHDEDPAGATLGTIAWVGHRRDAAGMSSRALPPLCMRYAPAHAGSAFIAAPAETQENVPAGLSGGRHSFVDLYGEGLPGILSESERAWFYKPNLGNGRFGAQALVRERPATRPGSFVFGDIDRNGNTDLSQLGGRMAGFFELDRADGQWRGFRPLSQIPQVQALGGRAQWVDLDGDGKPDIVVDTGDRFVWFPSAPSPSRAGDDGCSAPAFGAPIDVPKPTGAGAIPTLRADPALDFFFADMTGDGLVDLVRVQNGRVEYWPNLGNAALATASCSTARPPLLARASSTRPASASWIQTAAAPPISSIWARARSRSGSMHVAISSCPGRIYAGCLI